MAALPGRGRVGVSVARRVRRRARGRTVRAGRAAVSNSPSAAHQEQGMPPTAPAVDPWPRRREMPGLLGKNVLVTGGTSGIGQATAVRFAEHGANVAINYLTAPDEAQATEEQVRACVRRVRQEGVRD